MAAQGQLDVDKAQVGSNGYGFVYFDFNDLSADTLFRTGSGKICGAGAHFGDFERFTTIDDFRFDKLSDIEGLIRGFLQSNILSQHCKLVIFFINKNDILHQDDKKSIYGKYESCKKIITDSGKKLLMLRGSAKEGWYVNDALASLDETFINM